MAYFSARANPRASRSRKRNILLEDGSVWDERNPDDSTQALQLKICESCQSVLSTPAKLLALASKEGYKSKECSARNGGPPCSIMAIAISQPSNFYNINTQKIFNYDPYSHPDDTKRILITEYKACPYFTSKINQEAALDKPCNFGRVNIGLWLEKIDLVLEPCHFTVCAVPDDPAAEYITNRPHLQNMERDSAKQILDWMQKCTKEHKQCAKLEETPLPRRVLDVASVNKGADGVTLLETGGTRIGEYVALSYCWGASDQQPVTLTNDNYKQWTRPGGLEVSNLPATIRDAIRTTRKLGRRYLWVDALCIIQDNSGDMQQELQQMASIYKNACITIAAASAKKCGDGFLQTRMPKESPWPRFRLPFRAGYDHSKPVMGSVILDSGPNPYTTTRPEPLDTRGWALQEKILSPRLVIFGTYELAWQCRYDASGNRGVLIAGGEGVASTRGGDSGFGGDRGGGFRRLQAAFTNPNIRVDESRLAEDWELIASDYTTRQLGYATDNLVALAGVASEFKRVHPKWGRYLAGLWEHDLITWLSWRVNSNSAPRPREYIAPSWSWASHTNSVVWYYGTPWKRKSLANVVSCETRLANEKMDTGPVVGGVLQIQGPVQVLERRLIEPYWNQKNLCFVIWDTHDKMPDILHCLRMYKDQGMLLVENTCRPPTYTRVGWVRGNSYQPKNFEALFAAAEVQTITIV